MIEVSEVHGKILKILENKGPSLPINVAKEMNMSSLFVSAFLSELADEKKIKISHLKVGGSPLYFLEGQEEKLENFHRFMHPKEAEAFLLLKQNKLLKDSEQDPSIRVALRSIRDFAFGFKKDDEIYWRYILTPESEIIELLEYKPEPKYKQRLESKKLIEPEILRPRITSETKILEPKKIKKAISKIKKSTEQLFQNPLVIPSKPKKEKPKSNFNIKAIEFLKKHNLKIIEEKEYKSKEYSCIVQIKSELGPIDFFTQAKDKKTISETDLKKLLSDSQKIPLPAFLIYTKDLSKKAREYLEKYASVLKAIRLSD